MDKVLISEIENRINYSNDPEELKEWLGKLKDAFVKKIKWIDKLAILSDHQQERLRKQNEQAVIEQNLASKKQKRLISNELENDKKFTINISYIAADILSGDIYSIHRTKDGGVLIYLADIMGHGLLASLTTFPLSIFIKQRAKRIGSLESLMEKLSYLFETMLVDDELIAGSFFWFNSDFTKLSYSIGGMYPSILQDGKDIIEIKSNNPPAMNFMPNWKVNTINIKNFRKIAIFSDGLVEGDFMPSVKFNTKLLLDIDTLGEIDKKGEKSSPDDDLTVILLEKN